MNINSLTIKAQEALQAAVSLAKEQGNQAVEPLHLLNVLVREDDSLSVFLLGRVGVNVRGLRGEVERAVRGLPHVSGGGEQFFSQDTTKVIQRAVDFTKNFGDKYASIEHLLLGLIAERGTAADLLKGAGATEKEMKYERNYSCRWQCHSSLSVVQGYLQADNARLRQADDILPALYTDVGGNSRSAYYLYST